MLRGLQDVRNIPPATEDELQYVFLYIRLYRFSNSNRYITHINDKIDNKIQLIYWKDEYIKRHKRHAYRTFRYNVEGAVNKKGGHLDPTIYNSFVSNI